MSENSSLAHHNSAWQQSSSLAIFDNLPAKQLTSVAWNKLFEIVQIIVYQYVSCHEVTGESSRLNAMCAGSTQSFLAAAAHLPII